MKVIIQTRLNSTRLPNKAILEFWSGFSIIEYLAKVIALRYPVIIATPDKQIADLFKNKTGIETFIGPDENVMLRLIQAAEYYKLDKFIRVCGDNPFLDVYLLKILITSFENSDCDYMGFRIGNIPAIQTKLGIFSEGVKTEALRRAYILKNSEHVTDSIYNNPLLFNIKWIDRLTVDTIQDFENQKKLMYDLYNSRNRTKSQRKR